MEIETGAQKFGRVISRGSANQEVGSAGHSVRTAIMERGAMRYVLNTLKGLAIV